MAHDSFFWSVLHHFTKAHHILQKENEQSQTLVFHVITKKHPLRFHFADDIGQQHSCLQKDSNFINNSQLFLNKQVHVEIIQFGICVSLKNSALSNCQLECSTGYENLYNYILH